MAERDPLTQYLNELRAFDVLDAREEIAMAERIETLEVAHWCALLTHPDALAPICAALRTHFPVPAELNALKPGRASKAKRKSALRSNAIQSAALVLRAQDSTRVALSDADAAVRAVFAERGDAQAYLDAVSRARTAQQRAKNAFMTANLRLVVSLARRYRQELMPLADLIQEGNLGLFRAVERFDHRKGFRFSTYAAWWIRHGLNRALSDKARLVRVPVHLLDDAAHVARARAELARLGNQTPTHAELASRTGLAAQKVAFIETHAHLPQPASLDRTLGDDNESTLLDLLPAPMDAEPDEELDAARWASDIGALFSVLTPIEAAVLRFRFGLDDGVELTLHEVGEKYNLSRERIRQLQAQALAKLRHALTERAENEGRAGVAA